MRDKTVSPLLCSVLLVYCPALSTLNLSGHVHLSPSGLLRVFTRLPCIERVSLAHMVGARVSPGRCVLSQRSQCRLCCCLTLVARCLFLPVCDLLSAAGCIMAAVTRAPTDCARILRAHLSFTGAAAHSADPSAQFDGADAVAARRDCVSTRCCRDRCCSRCCCSCILSGSLFPVASAASASVQAHLHLRQRLHPAHQTGSAAPAACRHTDAASRHSHGAAVKS